MEFHNTSLTEYDDTEEFIENIIPIEDRYFNRFDCRVIKLEIKKDKIKTKQIVKLSTLRSSGKKSH